MQSIPNYFTGDWPVIPGLSLYANAISPMMLMSIPAGMVWSAGRLASWKMCWYRKPSLPELKNTWGSSFFQTIPVDRYTVPLDKYILPPANHPIFALSQINFTLFWSLDCVMVYNINDKTVGETTNYLAMTYAMY